MTARSDGEEYISRQGAALHPINYADYAFNTFRALRPTQITPNTWFTARSTTEAFKAQNLAFSYDVMIDNVSSSVTTVFARISFSLILFDQDLRAPVSNHVLEMDDIGNWVVRGPEPGITVRTKHERHVLDELRTGYLFNENEFDFTPEAVSKTVDTAIPREIRPRLEQRSHWALPVERGDTHFSDENFIEHN